MQPPHRYPLLSPAQLSTLKRPLHSQLTRGDSSSKRVGLTEQGERRGKERRAWRSSRLQLQRRRASHHPKGTTKRRARAAEAQRTCPTQRATTDSALCACVTGCSSCQLLSARSSRCSFPPLFAASSTPTLSMSQIAPASQLSFTNKPALDSAARALEPAERPQPNKPRPTQLQEPQQQQQLKEDSTDSPSPSGSPTPQLASSLSSSATPTISSTQLAAALQEAAPSSSSCSCGSGSSSFLTYSSNGSNVLARCTKLPSPVAIPPNDFGLTYLHSFLSAAECEELIGMSSRRLTRSLAGGVHPGRTSQSHFAYSQRRRLPVSDLPLLVRTLLQRVAELTGVSSAHVEAMELIRYEPGQFFKPHCDEYLAKSTLHTRKPRRWSIFTYLNDVPGGGGETHFTEIGVKFKPKQGDALWWENCPAPFKRGLYHESSEHEGCPPLSGVKYGECVILTSRC